MINSAARHGRATCWSVSNNFLFPARAAGHWTCGSSCLPANHIPATICVAAAAAVKRPSFTSIRKFCRLQNFEAISSFALVQRLAPPPSREEGNFFWDLIKIRFQRKRWGQILGCVLTSLLSESPSKVNSSWSHRQFSESSQNLTITGTQKRFSERVTQEWWRCQAILWQLCSLSSRWSRPARNAAAQFAKIVQISLRIMVGWPPSMRTTRGRWMPRWRRREAFAWQGGGRWSRWRRPPRWTSPAAPPTPRPAQTPTWCQPIMGCAPTRPWTSRPLRPASPPWPAPSALPPPPSASPPSGLQFPPPRRYLREVSAVCPQPTPSPPSAPGLALPAPPPPATAQAPAPPSPHLDQWCSGKCPIAPTWCCPTLTRWSSPQPTIQPTQGLHVEMKQGKIMRRHVKRKRSILQGVPAPDPDLCLFL